MQLLWLFYTFTLFCHSSSMTKFSFFTFQLLSLLWLKKAEKSESFCTISRCGMTASHSEHVFFSFWSTSALSQFNESAVSSLLRQSISFTARCNQFPQTPNPHKQLNLSAVCQGNPFAALITHDKVS